MMCTSVITVHVNWSVANVFVSCITVSWDNLLEAHLCFSVLLL